MATTDKAIKQIADSTKLTTGAVMAALEDLGVSVDDLKTPSGVRDATSWVRRRQRSGAMAREEVATAMRKREAYLAAESALDTQRREQYGTIRAALLAGARVDEMVELTGLSRPWIQRIKNGDY